MSKLEVTRRLEDWGRPSSVLPFRKAPAAMVLVTRVAR